jgi:peptide/nickel transport system ATP-binding protein
MDFRLERGEIVGISGTSGCGKSTFVKTLANYLAPVEGKVLVDGEPFRRGACQPVQLVFQHPEKALDPKWRMRRSLNEGYRPDKTLLDRFGIRPEWFTRYPVEISGGEMQRFCILRALGPDTRYLIADEMTTMLDAVTQAVIWGELLAICAERAIGLVVVSHDPSLLSQLCDRTTTVRNTS